jgi:glycosyltransferase involved in cell wall biosynthesis
MLFDVRMMNSSGIGSYIKALLPAICENFDTVLLTEDTATLENLPVKCKISEFLSPIYSISEQFNYLLLPSADLLFSPHYNVPVFHVRSKKRVVTIHDVYHLAFYHQLSSAQKFYARFMINMAVKLSDAIITVSEFSKKEIIKFTGCPEKKITVIHNGVKQNVIHTNIESTKVKYDLPVKYILFVGNVKPHKNLKSLLQAYLLLDPEIRTAYKIVIAGKKDGFITGDTHLTRFIESSGLSSSIIFTGYVEDEDMDALYAEASLFVFPSLYEGFGLPPLEAMLNNCPVIVSNIASLPEICGDASLYFDPLNVQDIALKIKYVLNDAQLRQNLIQKGKNRIKKFTWERSINQHLELFTQQLSTK